MAQPASSEELAGATEPRERLIYSQDIADRAASLFPSKRARARKDVSSKGARPAQCSPPPSVGPSPRETDRRPCFVSLAPRTRWESFRENLTGKGCERPR